MNINKTIEKLGVIILISCPSSLIILPIKGTSWLTTVLVAIWLYLSIRDNLLFKRFEFKLPTVLPIIYYVLMIIGLMRTPDLIKGLRTLETKIPLLVFPLVFFAGYDFLKSISKRSVLIIYAMAITASCGYVVCLIFYRLLKSHELVIYTFKDLADVIHIHPGYLSLYVGFSTLILIVYFQSFNPKIKLLIGLQICFLSIFNFLLVARTPLLAFLICLLLYLVVTRNFKLTVGIITAASIFLLVVGFNDKNWQQRILKPAQLVMERNWAELEYFAYDRVQEITCSMEVLRTDFNLFLGAGTGNDNNSLYACYKTHGYDWVFSQKYNAHNQYFQSMLQTGVLGGIVFLLLVAYPIIHFRRLGSQKEFLMFTVIFALFSATESTLEVQKGVVFFSFFYSLFVSSSSNKNDSSMII